MRAILNLFNVLCRALFNLLRLVKLLRVVLFLLAVTPLCVTAADDTNLTMRVMENLSPEIAVPESWAYASAPGVYFWTGFQVGAVICAFAWVFAMLRTAVSHDKEEL